MKSMNNYTCEIRSANIEDNGTLSGHAIVYGQVADMRMYYESFARSAVTNFLKRKDRDVVAFYDHNHSQILGRESSNTLTLRDESEGLGFDISLPSTSYANDVRELVARGDLKAMSFGFRPGHYETRRAPDGRVLRHYTSFDLREVSLVAFPAYSGTDVKLRSMDFIPISSNASKFVKARAKINLGTRENYPNENIKRNNERDGGDNL